MCSSDLAFDQIKTADADDFKKFNRWRRPGQLDSLQHPAIQGGAQMSVKCFAGAPSFHIADRFSRPDNGREKTIPTIGVGGDQSPHGIQHVENLGFFSGNRVYGDEGKKHSQGNAQSVPFRALWAIGYRAESVALFLEVARAVSGCRGGDDISPRDGRHVVLIVSRQI